MLVEEKILTKKQNKEKEIFCLVAHDWNRIAATATCIEVVDRRYIQLLTPNSHGLSKKQEKKKAKPGRNQLIVASQVILCVYICSIVILL